MARLSRITTGSGDKGTTHLADGEVVAKTDQRIECLGEQDEMLAALGMLISALQSEPGDETAEYLAAVRHVQQKLFDFGAELSMPKHVSLTQEDVAWLEAEIKKLNADLPPLTEFVLPGPPETAARAHLCRTICRRLERSCFRRHAEQALNAAALQWLNRLSDWLFVLSRRLARGAGENELQWHGPAKRAPNKD